MERTAHDLCTVCSRFAERLQLETADGGAIRPGTGMVFAPDLDRLRQRALNGCTVCQIVFQIILYNWDSADGSTFTSYLYGEPVELHIVELSDYLSEPEDEEDGVGIRAYFLGRGLMIWSTDTPEIKLSPSRPRIPTRLCSPEPGPEPSYSDEGINAVAALVKGWLADCRKGHAQCDTAVSGQRSGHAGRSDAPTRLVDVGEEGDEMSLRILLNNEEDPVTEYITLSYAWGSRGSDIKLTASNIAQMTDVVDWARLPKTIQEAVIFTRKLGVRYIWVDALCIMQSAEPDDTSAHEDWHREAERFGRYYRNSLLTIAATGAADSADGLFLQRPGLAFQPQPLTLQRRTAEGKLTPMTIYPSMPFRLGEILNSPLRLRGWAVQERILSKRVVHFATNCVLWECEGPRATEVYPAGLHPEDESHGWIGSWMIDEFGRLDDHDVDSVLRGWYEFVSYYTTTKFTYQLDRLPALVGLADMVHERIGRDHRYLAGIWEGSISIGLSWSTSGPFLWDAPSHGKKHMGERDSVPSWSWASARGGVDFLSLDGRDWDPLLEVESEDRELGGGNMTGRLSWPRLRLTGNFTTKDLSSLGFIEVEGWDNVFGKANHNPDVYSTINVLKLDSRQSRDFTLGSYSCLLVGACHSVDVENGNVWVGGSLVLESTGHGLGGIEEFRRIGFLCLSMLEHWSDVGTRRTIDLV